MYSSESPLAATPHRNKDTLVLTGPDKGHLAPVHPILPGHGAGSPLDCVTAVNRALPVVAVAAMMLGLPWCQEGTQTTPPGPWSFLRSTDTGSVESMTSFRWALGTLQCLRKRVREEKQDLGTRPTPSHKVHSEACLSLRQ